MYRFFFPPYTWETSLVSCLRNNENSYEQSNWVAHFITVYIEVCMLKATFLNTLNFLFLSSYQSAFLSLKHLS